MKIFTHGDINWRRFGGGTLRKLILAMRDYIKFGDSSDLMRHLSAHCPSWCADGDIWGYGEDMEKVRAEAIRLFDGGKNV